MKRPTETHSFSRRQFARKLIAAGIASACVPPLIAQDAPPRNHPLQSFDDEMEAFMKTRKVPGGALAVIKDGKLVYARGYGWADREKKTPVKPDSLFRIASISKPFTAVTVMKLVEAGKLKPEDKAFEILRAPVHLQPGTKPDPRLMDITIRHLLHHTAGWDRDISFDPMFRSRQIAQELGVEPPAKAEHIISYMLGRKLDSDPGARYAYSNFGFCVLGRIIEHLTQQDYESYVKQMILKPMGITQMQLGQTLEMRRAKNEVKYYMSNNAMADPVFPAIKTKVPWPYGGFYIEAMDSHGGWIASAVDLVRFASALDDPARCPVLKEASVRMLYEIPAAPAWRDESGKLKDHYYGMGWLVRPVGRAGKANYWHNGSLPGTSTLLVRRWDGLSWAAVFNQRSSNPRLPDGAIDGALHKAAAKVETWPDKDLFSQFT